MNNNYNLVSECLNAWGLTHLLEHFKAENVDDEAFINLNDNLVACLITKIGDRSKFLAKFTEFKDSTSLGNENLSDLTLLSSPGCSSNVSGLSTSSTISNPCSPITVTFTDFLTNEPLDQIPVPEKRQLPFIVESIEDIPRHLPSYDTDLKETLLKTATGRQILDSKDNLSPLLRNKLVSLIIEEELKGNSNERIPTARFIQLARQIRKLFTKESIETYYTPYTYVRGKIRRCARGKLFDRYHNFRRTLRKSEASTFEENQSTASDENEESADLQDAVEWLKHNSEPWPELLDHWKKTFRTRQLLDKEKSILEILNTYPAFRKPLAYTLFTADFTVLWPDRELSLYGKIEQLKKKINELVSKREDTNIKRFLELWHNSTTEDGENAALFLIIPYLMTPPLVSSTRKKNKWRPSKREAQDAFILHLNTLDELEPSLERQRTKCIQNGDTLQPLPVIIGNNFDNLKCLITIDNYTFQTETVLNCIDVCFKLYYSLSARYPTESQHVWCFLQKYVYDLKDINTKDYVCVNSLISDLQS